MSLPFSNISSFTYPYSESFTEASLNVRFNKLLQNDIYIANHFLLLPGIWHCAWYNDSNIRGYNAGDICWANTTDVTQFIIDHHKEIKDFSDGSPLIHVKLKDFVANNEAIFESYRNVLTGYTDSETSLPPLYDIGQLSEPVQLYVSLSSNNKARLFNHNYWKPIFADDNDEVDKVLDEVIHTHIEAIINAHNNEYHLQTLDNLSSKIKLKNFINDDFSNIKLGFQSNSLSTDHWSGFDYVKNFVKHPYKNKDLSAVNENQWFKIWDSGYLEHGGILNTKNLLSSHNRLTIKLNWKLTDDKSSIGYVNGVLGDDDTPIFVDESKYHGNNLVDLIIEEHDMVIDDNHYAKTYDNNKYQISLTPIYPLSVSYNQPNNRNVLDNTVLNQIYISDIKNDSFTIACANNVIAPYYSYHTTGYINRNGDKKTYE